MAGYTTPTLFPVGLPVTRHAAIKMKTSQPRVAGSRRGGDAQAPASSAQAFLMGLLELNACERTTHICGAFMDDLHVLVECPAYKA